MFVRLLNTGAFPRFVRADDPIALLVTAKVHAPLLEFEHEEDDEGFEDAVEVQNN